jgi:Zn finger protein HypA/HybF involved in hydrogenase expression
MHEYSLVQAMFDQIDARVAEHRAIAVARVRVTIGAFAGVDPALFRTAYDVYRIGTRCARAPLEIAAADGDDLVLEQLELEVPTCATAADAETPT